MRPERWKTGAFALVLFLVNLWLVRDLLSIEYLDQMGSIEGTHIALARWARDNWNDLNWFPLWYGGIPYVYSYPPLLPRLVAAVSALLAITPAHAYHAVTAIFYSLGPVTLFWLALRLCGSGSASFAAGLLYSLVSTSTFLIPAVRYDAGGMWGVRRLQALVQYGEGPHIAALTLLPLAVLLLSLALERRRAGWWLVAVLGLASPPLTNWIGVPALAMAAATLLLARQSGAWRRDWPRAIGAGIAAYLIASPWIPPSAVRVMESNQRWLSGPLSPAPVLAAWSLVGLLASGACLWLFRRRNTPPAIRFALLFLLPAAAVPLASAWFGVSLLSQPARFHLEMEMALALAAAFAGGELVGRTKPRARAAIICALVAAACYGALRCDTHAKRLVRPIAIEGAVEFQAAEWFARNLPGRRVFAPGSIGFFLNAFNDTPQFGGGADQAVVNPLWTHVNYQILSGENAGPREAEIALLWLDAFGVDAVVAGGPHSREFYKPFRNPHKFEGVLPELWRDGDDAIYRVPRRGASLAHILRPADLAPRPPAGALDIDPVRHYVAALDNPVYPLARMTWRTRHSAVISAPLEKGQILSVQVSYHPGWEARVAGQPRRVRADHLGQLVIEPDCEGACTVEISFSGGKESMLTLLACYACLILGLTWAGVEVWRRRRRRG
jgi:hypothetical protein